MFRDFDNFKVYLKDIYRDINKERTIERKLTALR